MLSSYRVIDLTDDRGIFCGRVLGDLGADVIKIEPLAGDPARSVGPFHHDVQDDESSLFWQLYAINKRSVALDIEAAEFREALLNLVRSADFLIESFKPGYLASVGLGYDALATVNPALIYVSITPFGQTGPYRDYEATDLTGMALSGFMHLTGDEDRPPVRVTVPQYWTLGAAAGAAGAMLAHHQRLTTGRGQYVDVSCQQAAARTLSHAPQYWDMNQVNLRRRGPFRPVGERAMRVNWECADGYVNFIQPGGVVGGRNMAALCAWMDEEGFGNPELSATDFGAIGFGQISTELLEAMNQGLGAFFGAKTKAFLADGALKRRVLLFPVNTPADIFAYPQLEARKFFHRITPPTGEPYDTLGLFVKSSAKPLSIRRRAPMLGEHTSEVLAELEAEGQTAAVSPDSVGPSTQPLARPFDGIKVLDFCWVVIGPMTTRYLGDYGADVVRVESGHRPDVLRNGEPFADGKHGINRSGYYANYNSGKRSLTLNMADERARAIAFRLATQWADVVAENFTPGNMEKWGLGYDAISAENPGVIMFSASMLGRGGPFDAQPGFGPVLTALSGHTHFTGWPDRTPTSPYGAYTDFLIPHIAISAIVAALDHRKKTGHGQHLDLSQLEASLYFVGPPMMDFAANGRTTAREGNRDPAMAPHAAYRCAGDESWCTIACADDERWRALCVLMGVPALADDARFARLADRKANEEALDIEVGRWTSTLAAHEVMRQCVGAGVAAGVVLNPEGMFADAQLQERDQFIFMEHPEMGRYASDGNSFIMSDATPTYTRAPLLGEHTEQICQEVLGMTPEEVQELLDADVLS
ncbi:MAG: CoA transferase [Chloroflexi bacterium]|nr:CoA transferase [Chloroflexota bacterium]